jgi:hypothetical protein
MMPKIVLDTLQRAIFFAVSRSENQGTLASFDPVLIIVSACAIAGVGVSATFPEGSIPSLPFFAMTRVSETSPILETPSRESTEVGPPGAPVATEESEAKPRRPNPTNAKPGAARFEQAHNASSRFPTGPTANVARWENKAASTSSGRVFRSGLPPWSSTTTFSFFSTRPNAKDASRANTSSSYLNKPTFP